MKKVITLVLFLIASIGISQTATVNYTASSADFPNPERGFYRYTDTNSSSYDLLNQNSLLNYRNNQNITLIFRYFYLESFVDSPISQSYLNNMQTDFNRLRNAGLKAVIRFAYSNSENAAVLDASKSRMLSHIAQLQPLLQANADVIAVMQAGFIGAWGEWYYTDQAEFGGWGYNQTNLTAANYNHRKDIVNAIMSALPQRRMVQIRYPKMKQQMYGVSTPLPPAQAFTETIISRLGHHNDCFLSSNTDVGTYTNINTEYPYLEQETKFLPMGGETCAVFPARTNCTTAMQEMAKFHWSYLNLDYHPGVIDGFESGACFDDIEKKLGYRFELQNATFPQIVSGNTLSVNINLKNVGFAAPFNERNAFIVLKNVVTNQLFQLPLSADPRNWLPSNNVININETLPLPNTLTPGSYKMYLSLPDLDSSISNRPEYAIRLANENVWEASTGFNNLNHTVVVNSILSIADAQRLDIQLYPVPSNDELTVQLDQIEEYKVTVFNSVGQQIQLSSQLNGDKIVLNTASLQNGVYFLQFDNGAVQESRKFIVRH